MSRWVDKDYSAQPVVLTIWHLERLTRAEQLRFITLLEAYLLAPDERQPLLKRMVDLVLRRKADGTCK